MSALGERERSGFMGMVRLMSVPGAPYLVWDAEAAARGEPEAQVALREARRVVVEAIAGGETVVQIGPDQVSSRVEDFDPEAGLLVLLPRIAGG